MLLLPCNTRGGCCCPRVFNALQPEGIKVTATPIDQRGKFDAAKWAAKHHLNPHPVAAVHFTTKAGH